MLACIPEPQTPGRGRGRQDACMGARCFMGEDAGPDVMTVNTAPCPRRKHGICLPRLVPLQTCLKRYFRAGEPATALKTRRDGDLRT